MFFLFSGFVNFLLDDSPWAEQAESKIADRIKICTTTRFIDNPFIGSQILGCLDSSYEFSQWHGTFRQVADPEDESFEAKPAEFAARLEVKIGTGRQVILSTNTVIVCWNMDRGKIFVI